MSKSKEWDRANYLKRREQGLCVACPEKSERFVYCDFCRQVRNENRSTDAVKERNRKQQKKLRRKRAASSLCAKCGVSSQNYYCDSCSTLKLEIIHKIRARTKERIEPVKRVCITCKKVLSRSNRGEHCFACQLKQHEERFQRAARRSMLAELPTKNSATFVQPETVALTSVYVITINGEPTTQFQAVWPKKRQAESELRSRRPVVRDRAHYKIIKFQKT